MDFLMWLLGFIILVGIIWGVNELSSGSGISECFENAFTAEQEARCEEAADARSVR